MALNGLLCYYRFQNLRNKYARFLSPYTDYQVLIVFSFLDFDFFGPYFALFILCLFMERHINVHYFFLFKDNCHN